MATDTRIEAIKEKVVSSVDFPKKGIIFRDSLPVMRYPDIFQQLIDVMTERIKSEFKEIDVIAGLESRGFLFGPILALNVKASFVPIRKKGEMGKVPGETVQKAYTLEYGESCFEMQKDAVKENQRVVLVDDLLATGGTMHAAMDLIEMVNGVVAGGIVVIELSDLKGREKCQGPIISLIEY